MSSVKMRQIVAGVPASMLVHLNAPVSESMTRRGAARPQRLPKRLGSQACIVSRP
jgi:hypothetical protein